MDMTTDRNPSQYEKKENGLIVNAPAKINLSLLISGKRDDGFHGIETVMAKIAWYDQIIIDHSDKSGVELICKGAHWAPQDDSNLVIRAARAIEDFCNIKLALKITLVKNIPAGTGLGSASSDCAATLLGINKLCKLDISKSDIMDIASTLGSDIPFFIGSNLAYCAGRGEIITEIDVKFPFVCLLILPDVSISTAMVYKNYRHDESQYSKLSKIIHPIIEKKNVDLVAKMCTNMLTESCCQLSDEMAQLYSSIKKLGMNRLCLSGSGSALYMLFDNSEKELARQCQKILSDHTGCKSILVNNSLW